MATSEKSLDNAHDARTLATREQVEVNRVAIEANARDIKVLQGGTTPPVIPPAKPGPPTQKTGWSINVSFERYTGCLIPDGNSKTGYRITDPKFKKLYGKFDTLRVMDWQMPMNAKGRNRTWANRLNASDFVPGDYKRWPNGVPIEGLIEAANATGCDIWLCLYQQSDVDHAFHMGRLFDDLLHPDLHVYLEGPNESTWQSDRGWYYYQQAEIVFPRNAEKNKTFGEVTRVYAMDCADKFFAFNQSFPAERTTRILGGQLASIGVLSSNILKHIDPSQYDAITCSGYFGSDISRNEHWKTGNHGLLDAQKDFKMHYDLAQGLGKPLMVYEYGNHLTNDPKSSSDGVSQGVVDMLAYMTPIVQGPMCLYSGVGNWYESSPWPQYTTDYTRRRTATYIGLPSI